MDNLPYLYKKLFKLLGPAPGETIPVSIAYERMTRHFRITRQDVRKILREMEQYRLLKRGKKRIIIVRRL